MDNKHTVFGKIVGGLECLNAIEKIEVDNKDRPIEDIDLIVAQVFVDPYEEADELLAKERRQALEEAEKLAQEAKKSSNTKADGTLKVYKPGVGKYINMEEKKKKYNSYNFIHILLIHFE